MKHVKFIREVKGDEILLIREEGGERVVVERKPIKQSKLG